MSHHRLNAVVGSLRRSVQHGPLGGLTDGQLIERWARDRDEAAFELLVWRHGLLVLNVCRRVLRDEHGVDAFQATFLTLVRKADAIGRRESVGGWLYTVAFRIACAAKADATRRAARERAAPRPVEEPAPADDWDDLRPVLDEEVNRLPNKYRLSRILCYLEGKTTDEAAQALGWPRGTVGTRLAWARERLRDRLSRRGVALASATLTALLAQGPRAHALAPSLIAETVRAASYFAAGPVASAGAVSASVVALSEGVLRAMWMTKIKLVAAGLLLACSLGLGTGTALHVAYADKPAGEREAPQRKQAVPEREAAPRKPEREGRERDEGPAVRGLLRGANKMS